MKICRASGENLWKGVKDKQTVCTGGSTRGCAGNGRNPGIEQRFVRSWNRSIEFDKAETHFALFFLFVPLEAAVNLFVAFQFCSDARRVLAIVLVVPACCKIKREIANVIE